MLIHNPTLLTLVHSASFAGCLDRWFMVKVVPDHANACLMLSWYHIETAIILRLT